MSEDLNILSSSINRDGKELQEMTDKEQQGQCPRIVSPVSPARLHCCYAVIIVLTGAVIALSVALSLSVVHTEHYSLGQAYEGVHGVSFLLMGI
ncbi:C-type lectin domain family 2 member D11-like [Microtus ochrogaster]|uniref:C-type lectin domain family 2 member D11-like n=1 Tax=Microtus ochrogaster TaxID=79684 RepID=A0ABM1TWW2_MICOH|nr:C-type lectin domain family 2 member D11-like [Microtus ochrogaster]